MNLYNVILNRILKKNLQDKVTCKDSLLKIKLLLTWIEPRYVA